MKKAIYKALNALDVETKFFLLCVGMMGIVYLAVSFGEWLCWYLM